MNNCCPTCKSKKKDETLIPISTANPQNVEIYNGEEWCVDNWHDKNV